MGPGEALIIGVPFVVLTVALIAIFRGQRLRRAQGEATATRWLIFSRVVALALVLFISYLVIGTVLAALSGPPGLQR
jgi:hypothetical protein